LRTDEVFQRHPLNNQLNGRHWQCPPVCSEKTEESVKISAKVNQAAEVELPGLGSREQKEF
jgi:hypothetical protein